MSTISNGHGDPDPAGLEDEDVDVDFDDDVTEELFGFHMSKSTSESDVSIVQALINKGENSRLTDEEIDEIIRRHEEADRIAEEKKLPCGDEDDDDDDGPSPSLSPSQMSPVPEVAEDVKEEERQKKDKDSKEGDVKEEKSAGASAPKNANAKTDDDVEPEKSAGASTPKKDTPDESQGYDGTKQDDDDGIAEFLGSQPKKIFSKGVPTSPDQTWDFSLQSLIPEYKSKCIWLEGAFYQKFKGECLHEMQHVQCPCEGEKKFAVCRLCHMVFCSTTCFKKVLRKIGAADKQQNDGTDEVEPSPSCVEQESESTEFDEVRSMRRRVEEIQKIANKSEASFRNRQKQGEFRGTEGGRGQYHNNNQRHQFKGNKNNAYSRNQYQQNNSYRGTMNSVGGIEATPANLVPNQVHQKHHNQFSGQRSGEGWMGRGSTQSDHTDHPTNSGFPSMQQTNPENTASFRSTYQSNRTSLGVGESITQADKVLRNPKPGMQGQGQASISQGMDNVAQKFRTPSQEDDAQRSRNDSGEIKPGTVFKHNRGGERISPQTNHPVSNAHHQNKEKCVAPQHRRPNQNFMKFPEKDRSHGGNPFNKSKQYYSNPNYEARNTFTEDSVDQPGNSQYGRKQQNVDKHLPFPSKNRKEVQFQDADSSSSSSSFFPNERDRKNRYTGPRHPQDKTRLNQDEYKTGDGSSESNFSSVSPKKVNSTTASNSSSDSISSYKTVGSSMSSSSEYCSLSASSSMAGGRGNRQITEPIMMDPDIPFGVSMLVRHVKGNSFEEFTVMTHESEKTLREIRITLQKCKKIKMDVLEFGESCIVKHALDDGGEEWHRAVITKCVGRIGVCLVDHGLSTVVEPKALYILPDELLAYRPLAIRVKCLNLNAKMDDQDVCEYFTSLVKDQEVKIKLTHKVPWERCMYAGCLEVQHISKWFDVGALLKKFQIAECISESDFNTDGLEKLKVAEQIRENILPCRSDATVQATVQHAATINEFYVSTKEELKRKFKLEQELNKPSLLSRCMEVRTLEDLAYPLFTLTDDNSESQVRVKVMEVTFVDNLTSAVVQKVDSGEVLTIPITDLKQLPEDLHQASCVFKCSLPVKPPPKGRNKAADSVAYTELTDYLTQLQLHDESVSLVVFEIDKSNTHIVEVFLGQAKTGCAYSFVKKGWAALSHQVDLNCLSAVA